ncbi:MAG: preprotein translocase subunit YajC [Angustibacter sp.]
MKGTLTVVDLLVFALPALLLLFLFNGQRKRQRAFAELQGRLAPGQEVLTTSGLYARIVDLGDRVAVLETAPGQTVRWDRRAIAELVAGPGDGSDHPAEKDPAVNDETADDEALHKLPARGANARPGETAAPDETPVPDADPTTEK